MQYEIKGAPFPAVICTLNDGEQMITEGGGMSWMSPNMVMETTTNGGLGKAIGRMFSGDKMFQKQIHLPRRKRIDCVHKLLPGRNSRH